MSRPRPYRPARNARGVKPKACSSAAVSRPSLARCRSAGRFLSIELRGTNASSSGGVFHGCRCAPISARPPALTSRSVPAARGSIATWYVVKYVGRTPRRSKNVARPRSSPIFSTVTPLRVRCQLSSSVSIETMTMTSRMATPLRHPIERAHPAAAPAGAKHHDLAGRALRGGPVPLVGVFAAQEVEPLVAALDRAADHHAHEHEPDTRALPLRRAAALIEVDRVVRRKTVPGRGGLPCQIERREPEPPALRHLTRERQLQALDAGIAKRARAVPTLCVEAHQVTPALIQTIRVVGERRGVVSDQRAFFAAHRLAPRGAE